MQDVPHISVDEDALIHVRLPELKVGIAFERAQVFARAGDEVVHRQHAHAAGQEGLAEMRADEAGPTGDDSSRLTRGQFLDR